MCGEKAERANGGNPVSVRKKIYDFVIKKCACQINAQDLEESRCATSRLSVHRKRVYSSEEFLLKKGSIETLSITCMPNWTNMDGLYSSEWDQPNIASDGRSVRRKGRVACFPNRSYQVCGMYAGLPFAASFRLAKATSSRLVLRDTPKLHDSK